MVSLGQTGEKFSLMQEIAVNIVYSRQQIMNISLFLKTIIADYGRKRPLLLLWIQ